MLKQITEDIHQLVVRFPFGMRELNSYLIKGEKGWTVIDTGSYANESIAIWEQVFSSGIKIDKLVLTHAHPDHIGLAGWFQEQHHVPVFISSYGYKEMQNMRSLLKDFSPFTNFFSMHDGPEIPIRMLTEESSAYDFEPDGLFDESKTILLGSSTYEPIWTPGHSPDHFCFYNREEQLLFIGDHVLNNISPIVGFSSELSGNPLKDYFSSLELIKHYNISVALPGHGGLISNLKTRTEELASRHIHRLEQVLESVRSTPKTSGQVCNEIYGKLNENNFSPFLSVITRFMFLESEGKVRSEVTNGKVFFYMVH